MAIRYEAVPDDARTAIDDIRDKYFPELKNAKIISLFDLKKRTSGGNIVLARIMKANDLIRQLTKNEAVAVEGCDYIITVDKKCWENIGPEDRERIIRHEFRHAYYDIESENNPYRIIDHSITDFYEEVELNKDDPAWRPRVATLVSDIYAQEKDAKNTKKRSHKEKSDNGRLF
jgi:hypothetical protein